MVGRVVDRREKNAPKLLYIGKPEKGSHRDFLVPNGLTNQVFSIMSKQGPVGDMVVGPDGFVEAVFVLPDGAMCKLKKPAGADEARIGVWGGKK